MDLVLEVRTGRERVTLACHGKLIGGKEADAFRRSALLLMGGFDQLTINLAGVRAVDCGGLGSLAAVLAFSVAKCKQVQIVHANQQITQMLHLSKLDEFLELGRSQGPLPVRNRQEAVVLGNHGVYFPGIVEEIRDGADLRSAPLELPS